MKYIRPTINGAGRAGHQFTQMLAAFAIAKKYNLKYIYTPFIGKQSYWNELFVVPGVTYNSVGVTNKVYIPRATNHRKLKIILERNKDCLFVCAMDLFRKISWDSFRYLKNLYKQQRNHRHFVAVHVRRGDISKKGNRNRWVEISHYCNIVRNIRNLDSNIPIHVYSDGTIKQLQALKRFNVVFYLNTDTLSTMRDLIDARILVTSKSNFCLLAAYSSRNLKLSISFPPYWYDFPKDRSDICLVDENGNFDNDIVASYCSSTI